MRRPGPKKRPRPNAKSLANLRPPIKKGEVRNPEGKNGSEWRKSFRDFFAQMDVDIRDAVNGPAAMRGDAEALKRAARTQRIENVWLVCYRRALGGDKGAQEFIIEHMQGMRPQSVEVSGPGGSPLGGGVSVVLTTPDNGRGPNSQVSLDDPADDVGDGPPPDDGNAAG